MRREKRALKLWGLLVLLTAVMVVFAAIRMVSAAPRNAQPVQKPMGGQEQQGNWVGAWAASQKEAYPRGVSHRGFKNETVRLIIHPHLGGKALRICLSNVFGMRPLTFTDIHVAVSDKKAGTIPGTDHLITFAGK